MNKNLINHLLVLFVCTCIATSIYAQNVNSDQWNATDALGRTLRQSAEQKKDKTVAMFYWTWHQGEDDKSYSNKNISQILRQYPEALKDYNHPAWGDKKPGFFYWEEPLFGYYKTTDAWVARKHAEMLADAKVDAVFFDCTNASLTWGESYSVLMKTWDKAQKDGVNTPKVAFMLPFEDNEYSLASLRQLYRDIYKPGLYKNLWFIWKGKPCIMAYPDNLTDSAEDQEIKEFFTFRPGQPDYVDGPWQPNQWAWLENYPQHGYIKQQDGTFEQVAVGVAQNAAPETNGHCSAFNLPGSQGRSYTKRDGVDPRVDGYLYGWNFAEQWDRAFELNPELVFVTGWNEYIAGMWLPEHNWSGKPFSFVDQFDWERSRDIEPNKGWGDKGDVYYYQLIDFVRKFKGMQAAEKPSLPKTIELGKKSSWEDVAPYYSHYKGNTQKRDAEGRYDMHYRDDSGRNDIVGAKVARDDKYIYFMVECDQKLTPSNDKNWMMLFIDADRDKKSGWYGYDFIVNRISPNSDKVYLEKCYKNKWMWETATECSFKVNGNRLEIAIPRSVLGIGNADIDIEFKWNDNMQDEGNIMDFYISGDTAPGGRFNFVYSTK